MDHVRFTFFCLPKPLRFLPLPCPHRPKQARILGLSSSGGRGLVFFLAILLVFSAIPARAASVSPLYGRIDLAFERNLGQADHRVEFLSRGNGYTLFLARDEAVVAFTAPKISAVRMKLLGQNRHTRVEGLDVLAGSVNYLNGPSQKTDIPRYKKVRYADVYPGIDVIY